MTGFYYLGVVHALHMLSSARHVPFIVPRKPVPATLKTESRLSASPHPVWMSADAPAMMPRFFAAHYGLDIHCWVAASCVSAVFNKAHGTWVQIQANLETDYGRSVLS